MITNQERQNMMDFLVLYFGVHPSQLGEMSDHALESTYEFLYNRTLMDSDF